MMTWSQFRQLISQHFDTEELRILCFDLDVDYDNLPGERKDRKVAELINCLRSRKKIPELVDALNLMRPPIHWEEILPEWESDKPVYQASAAVLNAGKTAAPTTKSRSWAAIIGISLGIMILIGAGAFFVTQAQSFKPVEPVGPDEYMVLVAELEHLGGPERQPVRYIADDLRQQLEMTLPNSRIRVRNYDDIITSEREALAIAEKVGADIIIWGTYDEDGARVDIQVGSLAGLPHSAFDRDEIAEVMDVCTTLTDESEQSLAIPVVFILTQMAVTANDTPEMSRLITMTDFLPHEPLNFEGNSMAAHYHRGLFQFIENPEQALIEMDAALSIEPNPLLYMGRGIAYAKLGDMETAITDWNSAARLSPNGWFMPQSGISFGASMVGDIETALANADYVIEHQEDDDWYGYYLRGVATYLAGEYELSAAAFAQAIEREPTLNWPYAFAMMAALRQGDIDDAKSWAAIVLKEFPDPTLGIRILQFVFGDSTIIGSSIAATSNLILGQYSDALENAEFVLSIDDTLPDMNFVKGFAHCNLGNYADAETAYTDGLALTPDYTLLYLLRAEVRQHQGKNGEAFADIQAILSSSDSTAYADLIEDAKAGSLSCRTFWAN